jgi:hypothetical protein
MASLVPLSVIPAEPSELAIEKQENAENMCALVAESLRLDALNDALRNEVGRKKKRKKQ